MDKSVDAEEEKHSQQRRMAAESTYESPDEYNQSQQ